MANNGEIIIRVISEEGKSQPDVTPTPTDSETEVSSSSTSSKSTVIVVALESVLKSAKNMTVGQANWQFQRYFRMHDDYIGQEKLNIAKSFVSKGAAIGAGFAMGGIVGGIVATIAVAGSTALDAYRLHNEEDLKLRQMDAQLRFQRERAGYSLTAGSIGENR